MTGTDTPGSRTGSDHSVPKAATDRSGTKPGRSGTKTDLPETNWEPTRSSGALVLLVTVVGVATLATAIGVEDGGAVAALGAACLAAALWFLTWDQWRVPATLAASLLLVPAGTAIAAGLGYELLVAFAAYFPAPTPSLVASRSLKTFGVTMILVGSTLAAFGAVGSVRTVPTRRTLRRCLGVVNKVAVLPGVLFFGLAVHAVVASFDLGILGFLADPASSVIDWLFAPGGGRLHLFGFWLLFAAGSYAASRAVGTLPLQELAGEATVGVPGVVTPGGTTGTADGDTTGATDDESSNRAVRVADLVGGLQRVLGGTAKLALWGLLPALLVAVAVPPDAIQSALPGPAYSVLVALTSSEAVRHLLAWAALVAGVLAVVAALVRRSSRASTRDLMVGYAPYLAGLTVVAGVGVAHGPVLRGLIAFVAGRLESPTSGRFLEVSGSVVTFYGPETVVLGLTTGVLVLATVGLLVLYLAFALGYASDRTAGPAFAGAGLFVAAAFAGTLNVSAWPVLVGLAAALVAWDAGEFATTLGEEVGRRAETHRVELLHALGSLSVAAVGAVVAAGLMGVVSTGTGPGGIWDGGTESLSVVLLVAVLALTLLIAALR